MFQYTISVTHCRVKMEESVLISSVDTIAPARIICLDPTVIVSINLLYMLKLYVC